MWQDLRFGVRTLSRNPGFAAVAILALGIGIGTNAAVFSLVNGMIFKPLPFSDSERILYVSAFNLKDPNGRIGLSQPDYDEFSSRLKSFMGLAAAKTERINLSDDVNAPDSCVNSYVTANTFSVLSLPPVRGRDFTPEDAKPGALPVAMLTYSLWQKRYAKDPSIVGGKIRVNGVPTMIIGVSAPGVAIPPEAELWMPYVPDPAATRQNRNLTVFGKLTSGTSHGAAQAEVSLIGQNIASQYPDRGMKLQYRVQSFTELTVRGPIRTVFMVLLGAVGFVLLIVCANVANLLLSRAIGRAREIAIRAAIGAGRWRVIRQLLSESLLLSFAGGLIGLVIASVGIRTFDTAIIPAGKPQWIDFAMDYRVFAYLAALTVITAILFGLAPALRLSRIDISAQIKGEPGAFSIRSKYLSGMLVAVEMTLAVTLLTGAGLMIRSFLAAYARPMLVDTSNFLTMRLIPPPTKYDTPAKQFELQRRLTERLRGMPGAKAVTVASGPFGSGNFNHPYEVQGQEVDSDHRRSTNYLLAGDGYFETLQISPRRGRVLNSLDYASGPDVAVINEAMARQLWPGKEPIGQRLRFFPDGQPTGWATVVGVVPDYLQADQRTEPDAVAILPFRQAKCPWVSILIRTSVKAASLENAVRSEIQAVDPDLPVHDLRTLDEQLALLRWQLRIFGTMFAIFAGIALLLAMVGIYAVVAYDVNQRVGEIALRVALGASRTSILSLVVGRGMRPAAIGLVVGLAAAFGLSRVLAALLVGVSPTDPMTFGTVAGVLVAATILGCLLPAYRAMQIQPASALRNQ